MAVSLYESLKAQYQARARVAVIGDAPMMQRDENMSLSGTALEDTGREQDCNTICEPKMAPHFQYSPPSTINTMPMSVRQNHLKQEKNQIKQAKKKGISIRVDSKRKL
jgi:hypothetical protein